jgi:succinyl-diaminopimelate desuccinylase
MNDFEKINAFIEENRDEMVDRLIEFVRIPSISSDIPEVRKSLRYILDLAGSLGFSAKAVLDERVGVIEFGDGPETLGILAHVDVVPPGSHDSWQTPPFEPEVRNGAVYGRGTLDDKGAVIASLYALKAAASMGLPFRKKVQIILGTQEEAEWTDMDDYVKSFPLPDYGFTPDGEFPLCNIEKGIGNVIISFPLTPAEDGGAVHADNYTLLSISAGSVTNIVPDACEARLLLRSSENAKGKEIRLAAGGRSVHSCMPEKGDNAIVNLCKVLKSLPLASGGAARAISFIADKLSDVNCGALSVNNGKPEYHNGEFIHKTCMSPNMIETKENEILVYMDLRLAYGTTPEEILSEFERLVRPIGGSIRGRSFMPATYISRDLPFMKAFAEAYETASGLRNDFTLEYGGSYAKAMPNIVSWGPIFPGEEDTCHANDEFININSFVQAAKIYGEAIRRITLSGESFC